MDHDHSSLRIFKSGLYDVKFRVRVSTGGNVLGLTSILDRRQFVFYSYAAHDSDLHIYFRHV